MSESKTERGRTTIVILLLSSVAACSSGDSKAGSASGASSADGDASTDDAHRGVVADVDGGGDVDGDGGRVGDGPDTPDRAPACDESVTAYVWRGADGCPVPDRVTGLCFTSLHRNSATLERFCAVDPNGRAMILTASADTTVAGTTPGWQFGPRSLEETYPVERANLSEASARACDGLTRAYDICRVDAAAYDPYEASRRDAGADAPCADPRYFGDRKEANDFCWDPPAHYCAQGGGAAESYGCAADGSVCCTYASTCLPCSFVDCTACVGRADASACPAACAKAKAGTLSDDEVACKTRRYDQVVCR